MESITGHYTEMTELILLGFPSPPELYIGLFFIFLTLYDFSGDTGLMLLIRINPCFQICVLFPSQTICCRPLLLLSHCSPNADQFPCREQTCILSRLCLAVSFLCAFLDTESFTLSAMPYDCHVAM